MPAGERIWLSGFLLLGMLLGLPGSLIITWQYHIDVDPRLIGSHFLALNAGYLVASAIVDRLLRHFSAFGPLLISSLLASAGLIGLVFVAPPATVGLRLACLSVLGLAAGGFGTSLLYMSRSVRKAPATAINQAGVFFGCGCLVATLVIGGTYFWSSSSLGTALLAVFPLVLFILFAATRSSRESLSAKHVRSKLSRSSPHDPRPLATALLTILLFFQFGNEWAIAGWLPLWLIHTLGSNPVFAMGVLAIYFLALTLGRLLAQQLLPKMGSRKLFIASISASLCGLLCLTFSRSLSGAAGAAVIVGAGFAPVFPLVAERLTGFSSARALSNRTICVAITGALCTPWLLGCSSEWLGMGYVMLLPAVGLIVVLLVSLLLMLESHLMNDRTAARLGATASARK